jgi:hypothetical protein
MDGNFFERQFGALKQKIKCKKFNLIIIIDLKNRVKFDLLDTVIFFTLPSQSSLTVTKNCNFGEMYADFFSF